MITKLYGMEGMLMKEIARDELKSITLEMLIDVANFCDDHGIRYYLCGGTLLGAVRHQGFIPWDDDIDIMMPRPDYIKFIESYKSQSNRYFVRSIENDENYWRPFAKVFDRSTILDEPSYNTNGLSNHVFIDVFPVDGIPTGWIQRKVLFLIQDLLSKLCSASSMTYRKSTVYKGDTSFQGKAKLWVRNLVKYSLITCIKPFKKNTFIKMTNRNASRTLYEEANLVGTIVDCHYGAAVEVLEKDKFQDRCKVQFETNEFWAMGNFKQYLENLYGNYMMLPPEEKRVSHHEFSAYWKE